MQSRNTRRSSTGNKRRRPTFDEFCNFVNKNGYDYDDARAWWEMTIIERDFKARNGEPIKNWKLMASRFCEAKKVKREKENA